jgi:hypothetical protein
METPARSPTKKAAADTYWLTRFILLRWLGFVYLIAFFVAAQQLVPLVGANGLTPAPLFLDGVRASAGPVTYAPGSFDPQYHAGSTLDCLEKIPMLFWFDCSDTALRVVPWIGVILAIVVLAGYANSLIMAVMWVLYSSIVNVGQSWYGYGWEIQLLETGFLAIFLCPLLDPRPFPRRAVPLPVIFLFRWLIIRIMLGSALIKLRGDSCWTDLTALYYFFETQPIPNPVSRWFHFMPHPLLQFGVILTFVVELGAPWFAFGPRWCRYGAGILIAGFQSMLIICGNLSFFNWLTILPALACFDDRFWRWILPARLSRHADEAQHGVQPSKPMIGIAWAVTALVAFLSINPISNLFSSQQAMNTSYDPLHLVNTYGAFGTVGRERPTLIFEGSNSVNPETATDWKEYPFIAGPWDPALAPRQIAPYQPHLDWQLWFAAMADYRSYPWTLNLIWKLLHNDPGALSLFGGNPFPDHPPRYIRIVIYNYHFAPIGNPQHVYWTRDRLGLWLPALSIDNPDLRKVLQSEKWIP